MTKAFVPGFKYDILLSYSSVDDREGLITEFREQLESELDRLLMNARSPKSKVAIFYDRFDVGGSTATNWEDQIKQAASSCALLMPVLSPSYLSTSFCTVELDWFARQPHLTKSADSNNEPYYYSVVGWLPVGPNPVPEELLKAQRHPDREVWLGQLDAGQRKESVRRFAVKLQLALEAIRSHLSSVFLGPAHGAAKELRARLYDELADIGYRVLPDADFVFRSKELALQNMRSSLVSVHFPGGGLDLDGLELLHSSIQTGRKAILVQALGVTLNTDEAEVIDWINQAIAPGNSPGLVPPTRMVGKTEEEVIWAVRREAVAAEFRERPKEFRVGIACEGRDVAGARELAEAIDRLGVVAFSPVYEASAKTVDKLQAMKKVCHECEALLRYWANGDGRGLDLHLPRFERVRYKTHGWYLAPPLDMAAKEKIRAARRSIGILIEQKSAAIQPEDLRPFIEALTGGDA